MSNTLKVEYHRPDGWHVSKRLERKARSADRHVRLVEADLALDVDTFFEAEPLWWEAEYKSDTEGNCVLDVEAEERADMERYGYWHPTSPCGGFCRRCLLHDDPGGCLG